MNAYLTLQKRYEQIITSLFKEMLAITVEMKDEHDRERSKLLENIPEQYHAIINAADSFDEAKMKMLRKRILDKGNDAIRVINSELENFNISFTFI